MIKDEKKKKEKQEEVKSNVEENTNKSNYYLIGHICKSFVVDIIYNAHGVGQRSWGKRKWKIGFLWLWNGKIRARDVGKLRKKRNK